MEILLVYFLGAATHFVYDWVTTPNLKEVDKIQHTIHYNPKKTCTSVNGNKECYFISSKEQILNLSSDINALSLHSKKCEEINSYNIKIK